MQGAESHLYRTSYLLPSVPAALKSRPPKPYRHPVLDARLTRHRLLTESRCLARCRRAGVRVPAVYAVGVDEGWLMMEWVNGVMLKEGMARWMENAAGVTVAVARGVRQDGTTGEEEEEEEGGEVDQRMSLMGLMRAVGVEVGKMHVAGVVHGDLTSSNILYSPPLGTTDGGKLRLGGSVTLIDFGLAAQSVQDEDRAVDLYVLERAFLSTHPKAEGLFGEVLEGYRMGWTGAAVVLKRLEVVRSRGRKRSMLG